MAAEALENAAREAGVELAVETQGSAGFTRLDPAVVAAADAVVFAHDVPVRDKERFAGKPTVDVGVKAGINRPAELLAEAREKAARGEVTADARKPSPVDEAGESGDGYGTKLRTWLMSGVSYMVPFVAAGGLLIALGFAIGGWKIDKAPSVAEHFIWTDHTSWAALLFQIGGLAFAFLVPVLAGYIAYGMADRPGLVPGFVGGSVAVTIDAGFLGGLAAGLIAGAVVLAVQRVRVPAVLRGIMPVVVIPLISSAVVGFLMFLVVGKPIASLQSALTDWLEGLSGANAIILGVILGLMMCFDLGGPLNKVAYAFGVGGLAHPTDGSLKVMAAVMAAGMVPPLAMALATTVRGRLFTKTERENGKAAWFLGASFITEGAIPFAAADPLRVIPASMAGGAVTGALSMAFGCTLRAPHGGVFVVPLIGQPLLYLVAIAARGLCLHGRGGRAQGRPEDDDALGRRDRRAGGCGSDRSGRSGRHEARADDRLRRGTCATCVTSGPKAQKPPVVSRVRCCLLGDMFQDVSIVQQAGVAVLAAATVVWPSAWCGRCAGSARTRWRGVRSRACGPCPASRARRARRPWNSPRTNAPPSPVSSGSSGGGAPSPRPRPWPCAPSRRGPLPRWRTPRTCGAGRG